MKVAFGLLSLILLTNGIVAFCVEGSVHKSKAEISRITPEERVEEACREYARHGFADSDYQDLLDSFILRDGLKAVTAIVKVTDEYDPTRPKGASKARDARCFAAERLLGQLDENVVRLRASQEGAKGIEAMRRLVERMRATHFHTAESYDANQRRYKGSLFILRRMEGTNGCDEAIKNTLRIKYKVSLSDTEFSDFVNYLVSQDPHYPGWGQKEEYKDVTQRNEAGYHLWFTIVKKPDPFYQAYLKYKGER
jgi:hypothetical protein